jgi:hypothetical protein
MNDPTQQSAQETQSWKRVEQYLVPTPITDAAYDKVLEQDLSECESLLAVREIARGFERQVSKAIGLHDRNLELAEENHRLRMQLKEIKT